MKNLQPAKVLLVAAVIGLGLSGGFAAAAFLPGSTPGTVAQIWDNTVGRAFQNGPGEKGSLFTAAATYIGVTEAQLRTELGTDKSLADVAIAHGKTRDGLIQALTAAQQQSIATLVDQKGIGARPNPGPGFGRGPGGPGLTGDPLAAASTYLGIPRTDIETKVRSRDTRLAKVLRATYREGWSQTAVVNSRGVQASYEGTHVSFGLACVAVAEGEITRLEVEV